MEKITKKEILDAKRKFGKAVKTSPLIKSKRLSDKYGANIYLKREDLQIVRSYKIRGAFNLISSLSEKEKEAGIVCASAGNHAQGVAFTCKELKIKGTIFMPLTTPEQKIYKTQQFGGEFVNIVLSGDTFDDALKSSKKFEKETGATFVHPYDDLRTITGGATIGLEIFEKLKKEPDIIISPIGGGGIISGLISAKNAFGKNTKIIGAEPAGAASMKKSLEKGKNTALSHVDVFVDGASVGHVGDNNFNIVKNEKIDIVVCEENRVASTILEYLKEDGIVVEPAGALATDALKDLKDEIKGKDVVVVISGGNFDFERLPEIKERSMKFEGLKRYFLITFPQRPGALKEFLNCLGPNDDIARFEYLKKSNKNTAPVFIGIETNDKNNWEKITKFMEEMGFKYRDVTNDDLYFDLLV